MRITRVPAQRSVSSAFPTGWSGEFRESKQSLLQRYPGPLFAHRDKTLKVIGPLVLSMDSQKDIAVCCSCVKCRKYWSIFYGFPPTYPVITTCDKFPVRIWPANTSAETILPTVPVGNCPIQPLAVLGYKLKTWSVIIVSPPSRLPIRYTCSLSVPAWP